MPFSPLPAPGGASIPWLVVISLQSLPLWSRAFLRSHFLMSHSFKKKLFIWLHRVLVVVQALELWALVVVFSCSAACAILVPQPGMEPMAPAVELQSLHHLTSSEAPTPSL